MKVISSQAVFNVDSAGKVIGLEWTKNYCSVTHRFLSKIREFDLKRYRETHVDTPEAIDILKVGYWLDGEYRRAVQ